MENESIQISIKEVTRLIRAASLLQDAAQFNQMDEIESSYNKLVNFYFVDPAMIIWYCKPTEPQNLSGFDADTSSDTDSHRVLATSLLTLDFIFSDAKAGAAGLPIFLSPGHAEELHNKVDRELSSEARDNRATAASLKALRSGLARSISQLEVVSPDNESARIAVIEEIFTSVNAILAEPLSASSFAQERFIDLMGRGVVAQITQHDDIMTAGRLEEIFRTPDSDRVDQWRSWLKSHRSVQTRMLSDNVERDAETLASIERLNLEARGSRHPQRFLFITSSAAIHDAMKLWASEANPDDPHTLRDPQRKSFARHPRQYIPIFNLNAAPGRTKLEADIFEKLKNSISDLATFPSDIADRVPDGDRESRGRKSSFNDAAPAMLTSLHGRALELRRSWAEAMKTAALLNVDALSRTSQKALNSAIDLVEGDLSSDGVNSALSDQIRLQTERMLKVNRAFAIRGRLLSSINTFQGRQSAKAQVLTPRLPLLFDVALPIDVKSFARDRGQPISGVGPLLDWLLVASPDRNKTLSDFEVLLQGMQDHEAYSLATAVVFRGRDWTATRYFASSCLRSLAGKEGRGYAEREMFYCRQVAQRFTFRYFSEFQEIRHQWMRSLETYRDDAFVRARALSEVAALELVCVFRSVYINNFKLNVSYLRELLNDAHRRINFAFGLADPGRTGRGQNRPWTGLLEQLTTNRASVLVQKHLLLKEPSGKEDLKDVASAYDALRRMRTRVKAHDISRLYEEGLSLILNPSVPESSTPKRNIRNIIDGAQASSSLSGSAVDEGLLGWFMSLID